MDQTREKEKEMNEDETLREHYIIRRRGKEKANRGRTSARKDIVHVLSLTKKLHQRRSMNNVNGEGDPKSHKRAKKVLRYNKWTYQISVYDRISISKAFHRDRKQYR